MISVILPARSGRRRTSECLKSLYYSFRTIGDFQLILIDDASALEEGLTELFQTFRSQTGFRIQSVRFSERQHYTGVFNYGLKTAPPGHVILLSNDMLVTPDFVRTLLAVASLDPKIGTVRGCSEFNSGFPEHLVAPPLPLNGYEQVLEFSKYVAEREQLKHVDDKLFSGDAVFISAALRREIGQFDPRYFGYFSDLDFGLRARRAGFRLVCAKGAWLHHEGAGHVKDEGANAFVERKKIIQRDYDAFRSKWDPELPEAFEPGHLNYDVLVEKGPLEDEHGLYQIPESVEVVCS